MKIKNLKLKIVFFGSSKHVTPIIEVLRQNFDLSLVVTTEKSPSDPLPAYCIKSKVRYYVVTDFRKDKKILKILKKAHATLGVLASFGAIIPNNILSIFPKGIINVHPSLLPMYRGPTPVQKAILNGDKITGVTIIKLDEQIDHGPILAQTEEPILETDTSESLYERLFKLGSDLLPKVLRQYINGSLKPAEQNHKEATFTKRLSRQDGYIDLKSLEIRNLKLEIARRIRAYHPWPSVWTRIMINDKGLRIKFLPEKKIQIEGKKPVSADTFKRGYPESIGWLEKLFGQQE